MCFQRYAIDFATLKDTTQCANLNLELFGPSCPIPNLAFRQPEAVPSRLNYVSEAFSRFSAVRDLLAAWEHGTFIFKAGFRCPSDNEEGSIIATSLQKAIQLLGHPDAVRCLALKMEIELEDKTLGEVWREVVTSALVSDLESGLLNVFHVNDVTGSGSDGLDPDGRERLFAYFGISKWNEDRNQKLVNELERLRKHCAKHYGR